MTIGSLLQGGFRLIKERPGAMLIWTLVQMVASIGMGFWLASLVQGVFDAALRGESVESLRTSFVLQSLLVSIVGGIVSTILYAAVQRSILRPAEGGPGWLKLGMDEIRFFLLGVLYSLIFAIAVVIVVVILAIFMAGSGRAGLQTVQYVVIAIAVLACAYFGTKLSLSFPLTLKEGTFRIGEGWALSNGRFWTLFGTYFIIFLVLLALGVASSLVSNPDYMSAVFQHGIGSPEADMASLQQFQKLAAGTIDAPIIIGWVLTGVQGAIGAALLGGAAATAVQELTADGEGLSETFS